jgi:hypothetical protein
LLILKNFKFKPIFPIFDVNFELAPTFETCIKLLEGFILKSL